MIARGSTRASGAHQVATGTSGASRDADGTRPGAGRGAARRLRPGRLVGLAVLALVTTAALSACSVTNTVGKAFDGFGFPQGGISQQSQRVYSLWIGSVIAALLIGFLVWGLIFWSIIRYRKRGDEMPPQTRYNMPIELLYTVAPFLIVSVLFFYTATTETYLDRLSANPDVTVQVTASKWNWQFTYLDSTAKGQDGQQVQTTGAADYIPVLVVPTHETVRFKEHSQDVIHSFWVPELLFKRDVFPGNVKNQFEVTIEKEGAYVGHCAELCGTYHSMMNFELRAVSPDKYQQFIAAKKSGKTTQEALTSIGLPPLATTTHPFANRTSD